MKDIIQRLLFAIIFALTSFCAISQGELLFEDSYVHEIRVTFEEANYWEILSDNYDSYYPDVPYIMADVTIDGVQVDSIGIRQKGFASHFGFGGDKKSLKIDFNEYVSGKKYDGLKKINLNNGAGDPAIQRDRLCYDILNKSGVNAARTSYAEVYLNDTYWGLYVIVEQIDRTFLNQNFGYDDGNLFKNMEANDLQWVGSDSFIYQQIFELKTNDNADAWDNFINLIDVINSNSTGDEYRDVIEEVFDVDLYLKVLAVDVATSNWDSYLEHGRNFYMYEDIRTSQFKWIPWDYNFAMGGNFGVDIFGGEIGDPEDCFTIIVGSCPYPATDSIFIEVIEFDSWCCNVAWDVTCQQYYDLIASNLDPGGGDTIGPVDLFPVDMRGSEKVLINKLLSVAEYEEIYYRNFCRLLDHNFTEDRLFPMIEQNGDLIRASLETDNNYNWTMQEFEADLDQGSGSIPGLKRFVSKQVVTLSGQLADLYNCDNVVSTLSPLDVSINEFMAVNDSLSGIEDQAGETDDWIELYNNTDEDIDLSYAYLTDNPEKPQKWSFPSGTTIFANDYLVIWADKDEEQDGLHCDFKLSRDGDFIMLSDDTLVLDSLSFGYQENNLSYSRIPNGTGDYIIKNPTIGYNNETDVAVVDESIGVVNVFPNPANSYIVVYVEQMNSNQLHIELLNGLGQVVQIEPINSLQTKIDLGRITCGIYLLNIKENHFTVSSTKVIVYK